jgi:glycosyltransferase involved in cell wall biosynthesis
VNANADITVVIACFNYGAFLNQAVGSALAQAGGSPRIIVVDDGSTDPVTHRALEALPREVEIVRQENRGVCRARNAGLARAATPYVLVLDADDRLSPGALRALRVPLDTDPSLGFAYGLMRFFGDWEGIVRFPPYDPYGLLYRHTIGLTALMRRELVEQTGGFDPAFEHYEDWELWLNALAHGWHGKRVEEVTLEYRRHGASKYGSDRRSYRRTLAELERKHASLYRRRREIAAHSALGTAGRAFYRLFWGLRPVPVPLEALAQRLRWGT